MAPHVLDTHAALWNYSARAMLGKTAESALAGAKQDKLIISDVTLSEIGRLFVAGKIKVSGDEAQWMETFARAHNVVPVSARIAWRAATYAFSHRDPCDRHILATADVLGLTLVTKDDTLTKAARSQGVTVIW